jgi:hypothetical protein
MLSELLGRYSGTQRLCLQDPNCDPLALGKLTKGLIRIGLHPLPEPSPIKLSVKALFSSLRHIDLSSLCDTYPRKSRSSLYYLDQDTSKAHLDTELENVLHEYEEDIHGLDLPVDAQPR